MRTKRGKSAFGPFIPPSTKCRFWLVVFEKGLDRQLQDIQPTLEPVDGIDSDGTRHGAAYTAEVSAMAQKLNRLPASGFEAGSNRVGRTFRRGLYSTIQ
jgi:hypothetical protein